MSSWHNRLKRRQHKAAVRKYVLEDGKKYIFSDGTVLYDKDSVLRKVRECNYEVSYRVVKDDRFGRFDEMADASIKRLKTAGMLIIDVQVPFGVPPIQVGTATADAVKTMRFLVHHAGSIGRVA